MASKTYEIAFKIAGQLSGNFAKTFKNAGSVVSGFSAGIGKLNRQAASVGNVVKLRQETALSARSYLQAKQEAERLAQALGKNGKPTQQMIADYNRAKTAVDRARVALEKKRETLKTAEAAAGTNGQSLKTLISRNDALARAADRARVAQEGQQRAMGAMRANNATLVSTAGYASAAGAGIGAGIMSAVTTGAQFEAQMSKVAAVSRASESDLAKLTAQAKELGKTTVWSSSQAAEGMQYLAMAGFKTEDTLKAMPGMLNLASAGAIDLGSAADIASNILTGFGLSADEMARVGDVLTNTFTSSNTTLEMLGSTMKYAAPIAKSMGVSIEQAAAMAGKLGDAGIQGEMAGTTLRAVMLRLASPSKAAADALADLGVKTTDAKGNMRDYPAILADIQKATVGMSEAQRAAYIKTIFETEAMSGAMILMEQAGSGALQKYSKSLAETGSATRVATQQNNNLSGDFKALTSAIEGTALQVYETMQPALRSMTQWATGAVASISKWAESNQGLVRTLTFAASGIAAIAAAALPMVVAIKTAQFAWAAFKAPILAVNLAIKTVRLGWALYNGTVAAGTAVTKGAVVAQKAFQAAAIVGATVMKTLRAAQLALNIAMRANPIGIVITLLGGLVAAGIAVYKNWDTIKEKIGELWSNFSEKFPNIAKIVEDWGTKVGEVIETVKGLFGGLWDSISGVWEYATGAWNKAKGFFGGGVASAPSVKPAGAAPGLASGGVVTSPTLAMIGEGRESEAVLPLSKLSGLIGGSGGASVTVNMTVNVSGASNDAYADIKRGISDGSRDLKRELERLLSNQRRLSFA